MEEVVRQLARIALTPTSGSPDEQLATPDETGSYGELVDEIDELVAPAPAQGHCRIHESRGRHPQSVS